MRRLWLGLVLVLVSCGGGADPANPVQCTTPPPTDETSGLSMVVDPNPAQALQVVDLVVRGDDLPDSAVVGVNAFWQCWDGSAWATTHVVYRGIGDDAGQTIPINDSFQIQVPSIGLALDAGYPIVIPRVGPGVYRIADEVILEEGDVGGFVLVEVVEG